MSWDGNRLDDVLDRVEGTVLGAAVGDALGAPWEFGPPLRPEQPLGMTGGGTFGWAPGEWTDDTSMAVPILRELADGADLADDPALGRIARSWAEWARSAPDVGVQTREVLHRARLAAAGGWADELTADHARRAAATVHDSHGRSAGNGSLMRTLSGVWSDVAVTSSTRLSGSEVFLVDVVIWGRPSSCSAPVTAPGSTPVVARGRVPVVSGVAGSRR